MTALKHMVLLGTKATLGMKNPKQNGEEVAE